jgi:hemerythrin-like domain-containing protein
MTGSRLTVGAAIGAGSAAPGRLTSDMVLVHRVFRRELGLLPALVQAVLPGDLARSAVLAKHCLELTTALRHHHTAEAELLWHRLRDRSALPLVVEEQLLTWHRVHAELIGELDALLPLWQQEPQADLQAVIGDILAELAAAVNGHLDVVEEHLLPAVDQHFSAGEWRSLGLRAARWIPLHRMAWLLGAMLEDATPSEQRNLLAKVPAPARILYRMVGRDQYEREIIALRAGISVS